MTLEPKRSPEEIRRDVAPTVVGLLMLLEVAAGLVAACLFDGLAALMLGLSVASGAGGASEAQVSHGLRVIGLEMLAPFAVLGILIATAVLLLVRRRRVWIMIGGSLALAAQALGHHVLQMEGVHLIEVLLGALHLSAIAVAFRYLRPPEPQPAIGPAAT